MLYFLVKGWTGPVRSYHPATFPEKLTTQPRIASLAHYQSSLPNVIVQSIQLPSPVWTWKRTKGDKALWKPGRLVSLSLSLSHSLITHHYSRQFPVPPVRHTFHQHTPQAHHPPSSSTSAGISSSCWRWTQLSHLGGGGGGGHGALVPALDHCWFASSPPHTSPYLAFSESYPWMHANAAPSSHLGRRLWNRWWFLGKVRVLWGCCYIEERKIDCCLHCLSFACTIQHGLMYTCCQKMLKNPFLCLPRNCFSRKPRR
jgi:hypothetical protein